MPTSDWSQFIPDLISSVIGGLLVIGLAGALAYFRSAKFKDWFNKLPNYLSRIVKWLFGKWYFVLPFCIFVLLVAIGYRHIQDWNIVFFAITSYALGLLSWVFFENRRNLFQKNKSRDEEINRFLPIPIESGFGNDYPNDRYINPPIGNKLLNGIPFELKFLFDTKKSLTFTHLNDGSRQIEFKLPNPVKHVKSVYILINSGNSKSDYKNRIVGRIRLVFKDAPPIDVELVLGRNIRDWCPGNPGNYVRETSSSDIGNDVWTGMSKNGAYAVIDCLKISVYKILNTCYLEKIYFIHKRFNIPPDTMGVHFSVYGISIEVEEVN
jgi:hypothetical protein